MAKDTPPYLLELNVLLNAYGAGITAGLLNTTERAMQYWQSDPDRTPRKETIRKISELFERHQKGENIVITGQTGDFKDRYIKLLEDQLNSATKEMRHIALMNHALLKTNQDVLIELLAKQRKEPFETVSLRLGKVLNDYYSTAKEKGIVIDVGI